MSQADIAMEAAGARRSHPGHRLLYAPSEERLGLLWFVVIFTVSILLGCSTCGQTASDSSTVFLMRPWGSSIFMKMTIGFSWAAGALWLLVLLSVPALSQTCALCYTQAAASGQRMIEALKSGILILIVPPTLMTIGTIAVLYHKRNQYKRSDSVTEVDLNW